MADGVSLLPKPYGFFYLYSTPAPRIMVKVKIDLRIYFHNQWSPLGTY